MGISGVVILYYPNEKEVVRNINSYIHYLDRLIVFDNSNCDQAFIEKIRSVSSKIVFISNRQNEGIAKTINKALKLVEEKSEWLLTMDQDSYFENTYATAYFESFGQLFFNLDDIAIICPNHSTSRESGINTKYQNVVHAITSGSIVNTQICRKLKGFEEKLFIDYVDYDYCYRCVIAGYKIIQFDNIHLNHALGAKKQAGYFSVLKKSGRTIHSPFRIYFMVRNFLYVSAKYKKLLPEEIKQRKKEFIVTLKNNLFFSGKFFKVGFAAAKGYLHFKLNKFSS